jgi:tetratricopeptide (TPR) repeat protein
LHLLAARASLQLNMNGLALEHIDEAAGFGGIPEQVAALRLITAAQRGDLQAAEQLMNWQSDTALPREAYEATLRCFQLNDKLDRANLLLDNLETNGELPEMVGYQRARNLEIAEDFAGAAALFAKLQATHLNSPRTAFRAGKCYYQLRDFKQAEGMFRKAQINPYVEIAAVEIANCLWEVGELEEAQKEIEKSSQIKPSNMQVLSLQVDEYVDSDRAALIGARIADARNKPERAVELLERVLAYNHRDFEARSLLIKNLRLINRVTEADALAELQSQMIANRKRCAELRMELAENPRNLDKLCELAELYWYTESVAESQMVLDQVFEVDPNCAAAKALLAKINAERQSRLVPLQ